MFPSHFDYHSPSTMDEVLALLAEHSDDAKVLAGGHSLLPMMKMRFAAPQHLIDLNGIEELRGIQRDGDLVRHLLRRTAQRLEWTERSHAEGGWRSQVNRLHRRVAELEERAGIPSEKLDIGKSVEG